MRNTIRLLIVGVLLGVILMNLVGCTPVEDTTVAQADSKRMFEVISEREHHFDVIYDVETGVMYARSNGAENRGTLTVLVNPDGTPRIWEGYSK